MIFDEVRVVGILSRTEFVWTSSENISPLKKKKFDRNYIKQWSI